MMTDNTTPLVSIIIRTCNRENLLKNALTSITKQDYQSIEVVIVNEGKGSLENIIAEFRPLIQQVVLIEEDNLLKPRGRAVAAQLGLDNCSGKYINFLDDDDWLLPHHISTLLQVIEKSPSLAVYSAVNCVYEDDDEQVIKVYREEYSLSKLFVANFIPIHSVLFDRVLLDYSVRFCAELKIYEDWDFWLQVAQHTSFSHVNEVTAVYRISQSGSGAHSDERLQVQYKEAVWKKWAQSIPEDVLLSIFNTAAVHEEFFSNQAAEMRGHLAHVKNLENQIAQSVKEKAELKQIAEENTQLQQSLKQSQEENIQLQQSNEQLQSIFNSQKSTIEAINHNQLRVNSKVNMIIIALPVIVVLISAFDYFLN